MRIIILDQFATVGIPNFDEDGEKNWSIVALSDKLISEDLLDGLQHLNTRRLDLVINNGNKFALLNLKAFKMFEADIATARIRQCLRYHITSDGSLLFGLQPSGDVDVITDSLHLVKRIRKPYFAKLQQQTGWVDRISRTVWGIVGYLSGNNSNQVSPEDIPLHHQRKPSGPSLTSLVLPEHSSIFPYLTSAADGFALLCAFCPQDCFLFLSTYETALRNRSIANIKGSQIPGRWYRIVMDRNFITKWLYGKGTPWFEGRVSYIKDENNNPTVRGIMVYAVFAGLQVELAYGVIQWTGDKFTLSWELIKYDLDWALGNHGLPMRAGGKCVARPSSDCSKIAVVISTHLGVYTHVEHLPSYPEDPVKLERQVVSLCNHSDFDGAIFYNKDCWVSDIQWLVEDAYYACMTLCGCLSVFHVSGEPMILKVRHPGPEPDENKSARFFFPVFHHQQISSMEQSGKPCYPVLKWVDKEKILTCSSGMKVELFTIKRVLDYDEESCDIQLPNRVNKTELQQKTSTDNNENLSVASITIVSKKSENNNLIYDIEKGSVVDGHVVPLLKAEEEILLYKNDNYEDPRPANEVSSCELID